MLGKFALDAPQFSKAWIHLSRSAVGVQNICSVVLLCDFGQTCLLFFQDLFRLIYWIIENHLQHDLAWMTNHTDRSLL